MLVFARHQNIERIRSTAGTKDSCFFIQRDNATWKPNLMISVLVDDLFIMGASEELAGDDFSREILGSV